MLSTELLKRIRKIEIYTDHLADDMFAGQYHSAFKGMGMEFADVRQYIHGDDVRAIDWRVTARARAPYIRQYVEERELTVLLMVDVSGSVHFGTAEATKNETMAETAATLAFSAIRNNDKVGLLIFSDTVDCYVPPRKGRRQVLRVIREVISQRPEGRRTDLAAALEYINRVLTRRAIVFVISDFFTPEFSVPLRIASRRHDLVCIRVTDPREMEIPPIGLLEVKDAETGERRLVDFTPKMVEHFRFNVMRRQSELRRELLRHRTDLVDLQAGQSPIRPLMEFFDRRAKRR